MHRSCTKSPIVPNIDLSNNSGKFFFIELEFFVRSYQHNERYNKRYKISEKLFCIDGKSPAILEHIHQRKSKTPMKLYTLFLLLYYCSFLPLPLLIATISAVFIPSTAADIIPPAYPAPSPQGYRPLCLTALFSCHELSLQVMMTSFQDLL